MQVHCNNIEQYCNYQKLNKQQNTIISLCNTSVVNNTLPWDDLVMNWCSTNRMGARQGAHGQGSNHQLLIDKLLICVLNHRHIAILGPVALPCRKARRRSQRIITLWCRKLNVKNNKEYQLHLLLLKCVFVVHSSLQFALFVMPSVVVSLLA